MNVPAAGHRIVHILVEGRVQGVGFRAFVEMNAVALGLAGWVRNRRTGAVEAVFCGAEERMAAMLEACRKGPPGARVDALYVIGEADNDDQESAAGFEVRPTA